MLVGPEEITAGVCCWVDTEASTGGANMFPNCMWICIMRVARDMETVSRLQPLVMQIQQQYLYRGQHGSSYLEGLNRVSCYWRL